MKMNKTKETISIPWKIPQASSDDSIGSVKSQTTTVRQDPFTEDANNDARD
jgi:hypothetical protein